MEIAVFDKMFTDHILTEQFPPERTVQFFEVLFGDNSEGAYDIALKYSGYKNNTLYFEFHLTQRKGRCLVCSLTHGPPEVFSRYPVIGIKEIVQKINEIIKGHGTCTDWQLGYTQQISEQLHVIPLKITLAGNTFADNPKP